MTLILPSCACTLWVYFSLHNLMLFFPQDKLCPGEDSELCGGGDSCHPAWGWRESRCSWDWGWTESGSWASKASRNWKKTTPFEHNPGSGSDENFRLKPLHSSSEGGRISSLGYELWGFYGPWASEWRKSILLPGCYEIHKSGKFRDWYSELGFSILQSATTWHPTPHNSRR